MKDLIKAINATDLADYFEFLDNLRESGATNMFGATPYLMRKFRGMARAEASVVLGAWMKTFTHTKPVEDRVADAIEGVEP